MPPESQQDFESPAPSEKRTTGKGAPSLRDRIRKATQAFEFTALIRGAFKREKPDRAPDGEPAASPDAPVHAVAPRKTETAPHLTCPDCGAHSPLYARRCTDCGS